MRSQIEPVLAALENAGVKYLVVGGVAVVLHGYLRTTLDLDLVVQLEQENLRIALQTLASLGFQPQAPVPLESFSDPRQREAWIRERNMTVFSLWHPKHPGFAIDLFVEEPFDFDTVYAQAQSVPLRGTQATVIALPDLIEMKQKVARPQDLQDIEVLRASLTAQTPDEDDDA